MGQTVVEKIAQAHMQAGPSRPLRAGDFVTIRPRHVLTHDNSAAVMNKFAAIGAERVADGGQPVFALDHDIQNESQGNLHKYGAIEAFAAKHGITFYPAGRGIGHQMMVENGHVVPGSFVVASDSHANTYGALGALGTPVVRTDAAAIWATGTFWWAIPRTVEVVLTGKLPKGVSGKDVIIALAGLYAGGEVLNAAVEFAGPGVASLSLENRLTIANMTTEWGALVGWFPVDELTMDYLKERQRRLKAQGLNRIDHGELVRWAEEPPAPDRDASYAGRITLDLSLVEPHIAGPDTVQKTTPLSELRQQRIAVHKAYLLSCVNSRYEDLAAAAEVLRGQRVKEGVELLVAAASAEIEERAKADGLWAVFEAAGATFLPPSCGPCIGLGKGLLQSGEVGISATNRNFKGRMGSRDARCYLASPRVVAASAVAGVISGGEGDDQLASSKEKLTAHFAPLPMPVESSAASEIAEGFVSRLEGRLVFVPADNLNTDGIYGKDYTYREDMTTEMMAEVVMENYDPTFGQRVQAGDILVGGQNFGTGSSREQAVTALAAKGIPLVIAASFSQTYLRNAFNNGFLCVENAELVAALRRHFAEPLAAGERTVIEGALVVDFVASTVTFGAQAFRFAPLSQVAQQLVVDGGIENQVRRQLGQ